MNTPEDSTKDVPREFVLPRLQSGSSLRWYDGTETGNEVSIYHTGMAIVGMARDGTMIRTNGTLMRR